MKYFSQDLSNKSETDQMAEIKTDPWNIKYIKNPSEAVQLAAVKKDGLTIKHIKNPSEAVQLAAVSEYIPSILYIKNVSLNVLNACKQGILKDILTEMRWGRITSYWDPLVQVIHNTGWPELAIIKKSLDAYKFTVK